MAKCSLTVSGSSSTFCPIDDTTASGAFLALLLITCMNNQIKCLRDCNTLKSAESLLLIPANIHSDAPAKRLTSKFFVGHAVCTGQILIQVKIS